MTAGPGALAMVAAGLAARHNGRAGAKRSGLVALSAINGARRGQNYLRPNAKGSKPMINRHITQEPAKFKKLEIANWEMPENYTRSTHIFDLVQTSACLNRACYYAMEAQGAWQILSEQEKEKNRLKIGRLIRKYEGVQRMNGLPDIVHAHRYPRDRPHRLQQRPDLHRA